MIALFIHVFNKQTFDKLQERGAIPLKVDCIPYIMLLEENTFVDFEDISTDYYKFSDVMYF